MTKETSNSFKGVLAIVVMTEHILQYAGFRNLFSECPKFVQSVIGSVMEQLGVVSVACFFMLSGYGLRVSVDYGGVAYARSMFRRKIIPFYGIVLISAIMYFLMFVAIGSPKSVYEFLHSFGFGGTIIVNGWFLQVILVIYLLFASIYSLGIRCLQGGGAVIIVLIIEVCCIGAGLSRTWYQTLPTFALGFYWNDVATTKANNPYALLMVAFMLFVIRELLPCQYGSLNIVILQVYIVCIASAVFDVANMFSFKNAVVGFLGGLFLEIYICHGLFLKIYSSRLPISNGVLYGMAVFASTIILALAIRPLFRLILNCCQK